MWYKMAIIAVELKLWNWLKWLDGEWFDLFKWMKWFKCLKSLNWLKWVNVLMVGISWICLYGLVG